MRALSVLCFNSSCNRLLNCVSWPSQFALNFVQHDKCHIPHLISFGHHNILEQ